MDDRRLEVVGIYSSLHVGRIQVGVDEPLKIGQAREIKVNSGKCMHKFLMCIIIIPGAYVHAVSIFPKAPGGVYVHYLEFGLEKVNYLLFVFSPQVVVHGSVPIQVDGEPWQQGGIATIIITHQGQSAMLKKIHHNEN